MPGQAILTVPFTVSLAANDYLQLVWLTTNANLSIETFASSTSPAYPETPGVIVSVVVV